MAENIEMKTLTIDGVTFEVVDATARSKGEGVFVGNYDTVTFAEIKAAQDAGKVCFLNFNGISLPLLGTNDTEAIFVREINENTDYMVTITVAGGKDFTIKDKNISDVYVAGLFSAKYADAKAAYDAGKACFVTYGALLCPMTVLDEEKAEFVGMLTPHMGIKGILYAAGTYDFQYVHSNAVQTVAQTLTDAQKAQARTNIGALSAGDVDTVLQQAKDSGQFDGEDGYTPVKGKDYFDGANGKTAYAYAQDGGYTGTEAEFAAKLASDSDAVFIADYYSTKYAEIVAARDAGKVCFAVMGDMPLCSFVGITDTEATFSGVYTPDLGFQLTFGSNGKNDFGLINSNVKPVLYEAQALTDDQKAQARTNIGAAAAADLSKYVTTDTAQTITGVKTFNAPANVAGTEQHTVKFKTSNGGAIIFGKEAANSGTMLRFDQVDGTTRLRFRGSDAAGAIVWEQPEQGAQLYIDLGKNGVDKRRITFPTAAGTLALTSQIPSLSGYLPLSGGLMTGSLKFQAASLPGKSLQYVCGVDAFTNGGEMGWQSKADFLSGYLTTTGTAAKATADANGNNIASTYANKNAGNTFNGEQRMVNSSYAPNMNDIASGVGCSLKNARACDSQLIVAEIYAPTTAATDSTINMNAVVGEIGFYHGGNGSGGQFTGKTQLARITSAGIYEGSTLLSDKYLAKSGGTMSGKLIINGAASSKPLMVRNIVGNTGGGSEDHLYLQYNVNKRVYFGGGTHYIEAGGASYTGTAAKATADGNGRNIVSTYATKDEVVTAANGSLKVTLSGTSVDKTLAQIETALNAGRHVYLVEGINVYQLSYHMAGMVAAFTSVLIPSADAQVSVRTVMVWDGMAPSVFTKTL